MRRPAIPGLRSVGQLDEGRHLSLTDHLQQLHVQTEEEVDRLLGDSGGSDSKAVLLTVGEPESVVNLAEKQPVVLLYTRDLIPTLLNINFLAMVYPRLL